MKTKTGTREWAESNENCISGCGNDCRYCYGKNMAIRYKRETAETWPIEHPRTTAKARKHKGRVKNAQKTPIEIEGKAGKNRY